MTCEDASLQTLSYALRLTMCQAWGHQPTWNAGGSRHKRGGAPVVSLLEVSFLVRNTPRDLLIYLLRNHTYGLSIKMTW